MRIRWLNQFKSCSFYWVVLTTIEHSVRFGFEYAVGPPSLSKDSDWRSSLTWSLSAADSSTALPSSCRTSPSSIRSLTCYYFEPGPFLRRSWWRIAIAPILPWKKTCTPASSEICPELVCYYATNSIFFGLIWCLGLLFVNQEPFEPYRWKSWPTCCRSAKGRNCEIVVRSWSVCARRVCPFLCESTWTS